MIKKFSMSKLAEKNARQYAKKTGKIFVNWNRLAKKQKETILKNPKSFFVLLDIRLSKYKKDKVKGIPKLTNEWKRWLSI